MKGRDAILFVNPVNVTRSGSYYTTLYLEWLFRWSENYHVRSLIVDDSVCKTAPQDEAL